MGINKCRVRHKQVMSIAVEKELPKKRLDYRQKLPFIKRSIATRHELKKDSDSKIEIEPNCSLLVPMRNMQHVIAKDVQLMKDLNFSRLRARMAKSFAESRDIKRIIRIPSICTFNNIKTLA
eukprot:TRINITY_DN6418_c0_g2_i2.p1 TRINITY_DN6418_c0_g2~~TRINITY_DN6418_c0_g2_i2.p1  ORF type:complete len:122 (+),score=16.93 TRINITY_DN6418_c0_g2_i2:282-647(+)